LVIMKSNYPPSLAQLLDIHQFEILSYLFLGKVKWDQLLETIRCQEVSRSQDFKDEQVWTFLMACGYALLGKAGLRELTKTLTGSNPPLPPDPKIWLEALPLPPRHKERNTNLDLALGTISRRTPTLSGIQLGIAENTWVCFCEMKYDSDISPKVRNDVNRNQLLRVIENALCFQSAGKCADNIYVTLVTRKKFQGKSIDKKYGEYFEKYSDHPDSIRRDLNNSSLTKRVQPNWHYPEDLSKLIRKLQFKWVSYEELFSSLPAPSESGLKGLYQEIMHFWEFYGLSPEDWYQGLLDAEAEAMAHGGVLSYTPLMSMLQESSQDSGERKRIAVRYLPMALSCALQNLECLQDIKNVAETYPDLVSAIITCAHNLRKDKSFGSWTAYESTEYKDFIIKLENSVIDK
jgi:hypothetical protein